MRARNPFHLRPDECAASVRGPHARPGRERSEAPTAEDLFAEIALILVIILGVIVASNAALLSLHIAP